MKSLIKKLEWDSNFFGYNVGKVIVSDYKNFNKKEFQSQIENYRLLYVYSKHKIIINGFKLVDKKITFSQKLSNLRMSNSAFDKEIRTFDKNQDQLNDLKELAIESGVYSRFNIDKNFSNNEFKKLYNEWILSSLSKKNALNVFICLNKYRKIIGFVTVVKKSRNVSSIGLIAVKKNARGMGVAKQLISKAIQESIKNNYKEMEVITQEDNLPAMELYKKTNFQIKNKTNIYHFWNL